MKLEESIVAGLENFGEVNSYLRRIIRNGVISTVDTQMIIDHDDFFAVEPGKNLEPHQQAGFNAIEQEIEHLLHDFQYKGLGNNNFHNLVTLFGKLLFSFIASDEQMAQVDSWHAQGIAKFGGFLMADGGGPSIAQWNTVFHKDGDMLELDVDKVWIIEGHRLDYGSIAAASSQKLYPSSILVPPEAFAQLTKTAVGMPFLDGSLQLGNVSGKVRVHKDNVLSQGGLASTAVFLSKVRPRFVRALMGHVLWLHQQDRIHLSTDQFHAVQQLADIGKAYCHSLMERKPSLPVALSIKFAANRLLLDLVISGAVKQPMLQRDLMAFTRMEGSSYRCLFEIYSKTKVRA
jgi:hypothetical protein